MLIKNGYFSIDAHTNGGRGGVSTYERFQSHGPPYPSRSDFSLSASFALLTVAQDSPAPLASPWTSVTNVPSHPMMPARNCFASSSAGATSLALLAAIACAAVMLTLSVSH